MSFDFIRTLVVVFRFFRFGYIAAAEFCTAADRYAHIGRKADAGYQRAYIIGRKEKQERTAGRYGPADNPARKPAFSRPFGQRIPAPPGGAGADRPGGGTQGFAAQFRRRNAIQRVQLVYPAIDKIGINFFFFQFRFDVFDKRTPHALFIHYPSPYNNSPF
jgi:hypothetical protein